MTAQELIDILKQYPPETKVVRESDFQYNYLYIQDIEYITTGKFEVKLPVILLK